MLISIETIDKMAMHFWWREQAALPPNDKRHVFFLFLQHKMWTKLPRIRATVDLKMRKKTKAHGAENQTRLERSRAQR